LRQRQAELAARNAVAVVVAFDAAGRVREYRTRNGVPFTCLVDERRATYRAYGFGRASWLSMLTPRTLAPYIRHAFMTRGLPSGAAGQDRQQLGGDVLVDPGGRIALVRPSREPADRPSVDALLAAIDRGPVSG